jgi:DNA-binding response OmpR family regulator
MKILIIEDDIKILSFLQRGLEEDGHIIDRATTGDEAEYLAEMNCYDVIILDWMLPNKSGIEVLEYFESNHIQTPVLMLTAKGELDDKVQALRGGADDYLTKPFDYEELLVRLEVLYRRTLTNGSNLVQIQDLSIDINTKMIKKGNDTIALSAKEYELLLFLIKHKNGIVSNAMIEEQLWNNESFINSNVISVTIYHLRKKIGKGLIKSHRGMGYQIVL